MDGIYDDYAGIEWENELAQDGGGWMEFGDVNHQLL